MLEVVIFLIDQVDALLRDLVIAVLHLQELLLQFGLRPGADLYEQVVVQKQDDHAAKIRERPHNEDLVAVAHGKRRIGHRETDIGDEIGARRDHQSPRDVPASELQEPGVLLLPLLQNIDDAEDNGVNGSHKRAHERQRSPGAQSGDAVKIEKPTQRSRQLSQHKRPRAVVDRLSGRHVAQKVHQQIDHADLNRDKQEEQIDRRMIRERHKSAEQDKKERRNKTAFHSLHPLRQKSAVGHPRKPVGDCI